MKLISGLLFVCLFILAENIQAQNYLTWYDNVDEAYNVARSDGKTLLVFFTGSDWCGWCKRLEAEVFSQNEFARFASNNLILVKLDFPKKKYQSDEVKMYNQKLAQKFRVTGYPTVFLINPNGEAVCRTSYMEGGASAYVKYLQAFM